MATTCRDGARARRGENKDHKNAVKSEPGGMGDAVFRTRLGRGTTGRFSRWGLSE